MDNRDDIFNVTHNHGEEEQPEKPAENDTPPPAPEINQPAPPVYDAFMYEPIGFADTDRQAAEAIAREEEKKERRLRRRRERSIILLFVFLLLVTVGLSVYGIVTDLIHGKKTVGGAAGVQPIVLYSNSKPAGANDPENFIDENGRYTTEGAAAAVKPCIVEIYTYSDALRKNLTGTGSGVVISEDGYIVTNAHVLDANGYHDIHTVDDEVYSAKVIGRDSKTDIAVIKVSDAPLQPAVLGDSDETMVGEQVIAIGNPAGLSSTVTDGIVSAVNRKIRSDATGFQMDCIQTNADISPGNSGGALVNMYGQVIGITSSKYVSSSYEGLGFAITINEAKPIIEELISNGFIGGRFRIGITLIDMSTDEHRSVIEKDIGFELPEDFTGIYITDISKDCDISNTDLKVHDFIVAINGKTVTSYDDLHNTLSASYGAGDTVPATCAHLEKDKDIEYYEIKFKLMEDTSGDF